MLLIIKLPHFRSSWIKAVWHSISIQVEPTGKPNVRNQCFIRHGSDKGRNQNGRWRCCKTTISFSHIWEGEVRVQMGGKGEDILAPVQILHKDDSRNGCRLFDWTPGKVIKIHFPLELRFNTISSFRIFNCWGNQVSNGCPWRQIEAQTEEPETIHKGILSNLLKITNK